MAHSTVIFIQIVDFIFTGAAIIFSLVATMHSLKQQRLLKEMGSPGRSSRKSARIVQRWFFRTMLLWTAASVCHLMLPHNSFDSIFYGIMCFWFLGVAAFIFEMIRIGRWKRQKCSDANPAR